MKGGPHQVANAKHAVEPMTQHQVSLKPMGLQLVTDVVHGLQWGSAWRTALLGTPTAAAACSQLHPREGFRSWWLPRQ